MNSAIVHFARLQETPSQCALALCHAVFPVLRLPALRPPASQCAPILTRMSVLLQGGRFCQSVVHCVFCTISTDFSSSEALCFISLTLAACPDLWILQSVKFAFWTLRRQGLVRRLLIFITETECVYCAVRFTFYVLPTQRIYVFCVDLRTNSDYFTLQH